jgi:hypothetical protein
MKTRITLISLAVCASIALSGCATIFGGPVSECQRTKPAPGQPARAIRGGALIADVILFVPGVIVDFATGAIYKPCNK